jgi:hypothetical protein
MSMTYLDPEIWGPHYWFFLHTISMTYPKYPNAVTKKKYYEFIQNLPLFIPVENISTEFYKLIEEYPITPYLDNKESLIRWTHFIHNKINAKLEKPSISLGKFYENYYDAYKPKNMKMMEYYKLRQKIIYITVICFIIGAIYYLYDK